MTVKFAGFSNEARNRVLQALNYSVISYNGRINDAPRQYRHIFRDLSEGFWVIDNNSKKVLEQKIHIDGLDTRDAHQHGISQGFLIAVMNEIAEEDNAVFYYVDSSGLQSLDFRLGKNKVEYRFDRIVRKQRLVAGYYAYDGENVLGPFTTLEDMILDLLQDQKYAYICKHADIPVARRANAGYTNYKVHMNLSLVEISKGSWAVFDRGGLAAVFFNSTGKELIAQLGI